MPKRLYIEIDRSEVNMLREQIVERCNAYGTSDAFARGSQGLATFLTFPLILADRL
jgi:hypothetical protein